MHFEKIDSITHFNDNVFRNTPILRSEEDALLDLVDDQFDLNVAKKIINKNHPLYLRKIEYHAIDYVFNQASGFQSRFSDT